MKFSGLKDVLKRFDNHGWEGSFTSGYWSIANGGYDLWFELYYKGQPVAECVAGELSCNTSLISDSDKETLIKKVLEVYDDLGVQCLAKPVEKPVLDSVIKSCEELSNNSVRSGEQHDMNRDER